MKKSESFMGGSGGSLASGLNIKEKITETPKALGMATKSKAKNQVPVGPAKGKAKGPFSFC